MNDGKQADGIDGHPPLIVWCADSQAGAPVLAALRARFDLKLSADLPDVSAGVSDEGADILLLCLSPAETLCRAMSAGTLPGVALKDWQAQAQGIIALNRRNRRKVRIVDIHMARDHPAAFRRWFGLPVDEEQTGALSNGLQGRKPDRDEILHLLAQRALQGDMSARLLLGELEAVSLNFAEETGTDADDPDAAFLSYQDMRLQQPQGELLQAQNRAAQEEAETQNKRRQELEILVQGTTQLEQRLEQMSQGIESYQVQVARLKRRNVEKEQALRQAGEMLRGLEVQVDHMAQEQQQLEAAKEGLRRLMASKSYRLTVPLRKLRALMSGRKPV